MPTKRPALSAILGAGKPIDPPKEMSPPPAAEKTTAKEKQKTSHAPRPTRKTMSRRAAGHVQLNVLLPSDLRKRAKVKALQEDKELSEVVETLLENWVSV